MTDQTTALAEVPGSATVYPDQGMIHVSIHYGAVMQHVVVEVDGHGDFDVDAPNARKLAAMLLNSADLLDRVGEIAEPVR